MNFGKHYRSLRFQMGVRILIFSLLFMATSISISYHLFKEEFYEDFYSDNTTNSIIMSESVSKSKVMELSNAVQICYSHALEDGVEMNSKEYYAYFEEVEASSVFDKLQSNVESYYETFNDYGVCYGFFDLENNRFISITAKDYYEEDCLGYCMQLTQEEMDSILNTTQSGTNPYVIEEFSGKKLYSFFNPVNYHGETIAYASVSNTDTALKKKCSNLHFHLVEILSLLTIALLAIFVFFVDHSLVKPLHKIIEATKSFVSRDNKSIEVQNDLVITQKNEIGELYDSIKSMESDIQTYIQNIEKETKDRERIATELYLAEQIQKAVLPTNFIHNEKLDMYAYMDPAREVGGDFYDFFYLDEDHLVLEIADVSGKGMPAAMVMTSTMSLIKSNLRNGLSPKEAISAVNKQTCTSDIADMFITVWLGILEVSTGHLVACNAGHEYPMLQQANGQFEIYKDKHNLVIGAMEDVAYTEYELNLTPQSTLFVYTDGIPEATNRENEQYGMNRLLEALNNKKVSDTQTLVGNVFESLTNFVDGAEQFDDITMLCISYK